MPTHPVRLCETRIAVTVNLTRIYTKLGDGGETHLGDMSRVSKLDPRVEAYGTVDELNATLGVALLQPGLPQGFVEWLRRVQNDLLDLGADLSVPAAPAAGDSSSGKAKRERLRIGPPYTEWLEHACDEVNATLAPLRSFVIPGGTPASAHLHICRTVCRRAERRAIAVGEDVNPEVVRYLNRLSDLLFILGRAVNGSPPTRVGSEAPESRPESEGSKPPESEPLWDPGAHGSNTASQSA
jgi:cob(I)alamin adenosyltransferase